MCIPCDSIPFGVFISRLQRFLPRILYAPSLPLQVFPPYVLYYFEPCFLTTQSHANKEIS